jgi:dihydroorotate dehydrogenase (NAD+) catalytic subunit
MHRAGSDVVGMGSAFGTMHQREWPGLLRSLTGDDSGLADRVADRHVVAPGRDEPGSGRDVRRSNTSAPVPLGPTAMAFTRFHVASTEPLGADIVELTLSGSLCAAPGQTVFLWIPGIGEKPFAAALNDPPTFLVKVKGTFTRALAGLKPADDLYIRGPYGDRHPVAQDNRPVMMVVAGTGLAAVSLLAHELLSAGRRVTVLLGLRDDVALPPLRNDPVLGAVTTVVRDNGAVGAVLDVFADRLRDEPQAITYTVGPKEFTDRATAVARAAGMDAASIYVSLERTMLCGVGLCGACSCGGKLTCQFGTFVSAAELEQEPLTELGGEDSDG